MSRDRGPARTPAAHPARDRFLHQARDDNPDPGQRDAARATLAALAAGRYPPPPEALAPRTRPVASTRRLLGLAEACPWRTKEPGCCTGYLAWCGVARSGRVAQLDCIECVGLADMPHPSGSRAGPRE